MLTLLDVIGRFDVLDNLAVPAFVQFFPELHQTQGRLSGSRGNPRTRSRTGGVFGICRRR